MSKTVKIRFSDLNPAHHTPIFTYCRKLIADGVDPSSWLEICRNREEWDVRLKVGWGARMNVKEEPFPHFVEFKGWKGMPKQQKAVSSSHVGAQDRLFSSGLTEAAC